MRLAALASLALLAAAPVSAKSLTVRMGETWVFNVAHGQPANARKAAPAARPANGEIKVTLSPLMGTTLTISNNSKFDYGYRATLILPNGKAGPGKSCAVPANGRLAMEHWPQRVAAVRLGNFKQAPAGSLCP
jgi:hypothetical protein